jgi:hypothetical protein
MCRICWTVAVWQTRWQPGLTQPMLWQFPEWLRGRWAGHLVCWMASAGRRSLDVRLGGFVEVA